MVTCGFYVNMLHVKRSTFKVAVGRHACTPTYTLTNISLFDKRRFKNTYCQKKGSELLFQSKILFKRIPLNCCSCVRVCCERLLTWCPVTSVHLWFLTPGSLQRDFWPPDPSPVSRRTVAAGGAGTADRATLRKTVSVDDRLLQPESDGRPHLRLLSRLKKGRKKLHNIQVGFLSTSFSPRSHSEVLRSSKLQPLGLFVFSCLDCFGASSFHV